MRKITILSAIIISIITGCNHGKTANSNSVSVSPDKSANSSDPTGIYRGILPCADCEGIKTEIKLNKDLTFESAGIYLGKSDQVYRSSGTFSWNETNNTITFKSEKEPTEQSRYLVGENKLIKLDAEGKRIEGALSEMYILKKVFQDKSITDKYWKLIELRGTKIAGNRGNNQEAHFILHPGNNRISGNGGCNAFNGGYELSEGNRIKFSDMASTKMACDNMETETGYLNALGAADNYALKGDTLSLNKARMAPLAKFILVIVK